MGPFLRWAGSKRKLVPILKAFWRPTYARYVEPFMGSACLFFALEPRRAVLADINEQLVHVFNAVADDPLGVFNSYKNIYRNEVNYYKIRSLDPMTLSDNFRAARFIYLNRFCFNGLFRTNQTGQFNVPYGGQRNGQLPSLAHLRLVSSRLKEARLLCGDFSAIIYNNVQSNDFVYLDPPFAVQNRRIFAQYNPATFGLADLDRLSSILEEIHNRHAAFLLSYADTLAARKRFARWQIVRHTVLRNIAGFAEHRRLDRELLVTNVVDR